MKRSDEGFRLVCQLQWFKWSGRGVWMHNKQLYGWGCCWLSAHVRVVQYSNWWHLCVDKRYLSKHNVWALSKCASHKDKNQGGGASSDLWSVLKKNPKHNILASAHSEHKSLFVLCKCIIFGVLRQEFKILVTKNARYIGRQHPSPPTRTTLVRCSIKFMWVQNLGHVEPSPVSRSNDTNHRNTCSKVTYNQFLRLRRTKCTSLTFVYIGRTRVRAPEPTTCMGTEPTARSGVLLAMASSSAIIWPWWMIHGPLLCVRC